LRISYSSSPLPVQKADRRQPGTLDLSFRETGKRGVDNQWDLGLGSAGDRKCMASFAVAGIFEEWAYTACSLKKAPQAL
jgi:hypothetical protein